MYLLVQVKYIMLCQHIIYFNINPNFNLAVHSRYLCLKVILKHVPDRIK